MTEHREQAGTEQNGLPGTPAPQTQTGGQQQPPPAGTDEEMREDYAAADEHPLADPAADPRQDEQDRS